MSDAEAVSDPAVRAAAAETWLKRLLGLMVLWDLGLAIYAVGFAHQFQEFVRFAPEPEPLFVRGTGMYWLFAAWFQLLGALNPRKFVVAIQLAIFFRLSAAVIDSCEVLFLLPRPWYFFHSMLTFFVAANLVIAFAEAKLLGRMGLKWFDVSRD